MIILIRQKMIEVFTIYSSQISDMITVISLYIVSVI